MTAEAASEIGKRARFRVKVYDGENLIAIESGRKISIKRSPSGSMVITIEPEDIR